MSGLEEWQIFVLDSFFLIDGEWLVLPANSEKLVPAALLNALAEDDR